MRLSKRMPDFDMTEVRAMFERASLCKNPIDLSVGQPDFEASPQLCQAAVTAIGAGKNRYTPAAGISELRERILRELWAESIPSEAVISTAGASGGLLLGLWALADEETDVFLPDPYFIGYPHLARLAGANIRYIDQGEDFRLTPGNLERAFSSSTSRRVLIFNSPNNPTGIVYSRDEISALQEVTKRYDVRVISDEVYNHFCFDRKFESWGIGDPGALVVRSLGKSWSVTGWRTGFAAGPKELIEAMTALQQVTFVCTNSVAQWASLEAFNVPTDQHLNIFRERRDTVCEILGGRFEFQRPGGAFYAYAGIPGGRASEFFARCLAREVLIVPGRLFSRTDTHFRLSFALSEEKLRDGLQRLLMVANDLGV